MCDDVGAIAVSIMLPSLYAHQQQQTDRARQALQRFGRIILTAPPGTGKTRMSKWILGSSLNRARNSLSDRQSGRTLFTVHRRGLVDNAIESFAEDHELPHGVIMSNRDTSYHHRIQIASIDSLLSWFVEDDQYQTDMTFDLIIFDEAHSHHTKFARFLKYHDRQREQLNLHRAFVIGLTATPQAAGLSDVYGTIVDGPRTKWLIANHYLSPFRYYAATPGRLDKLVKRGGEFTKTSVCNAMDCLAGKLVRDWTKFASDRPTVGFFPRRSHAQDAMSELQRAGVRVAYVDGETPDDKRRMIFRQLNNHEIDYLCNVQVVERGTDIPAISCVQLCVATASLVRYRQLIGRGSRIHQDKTDCIVLDHGGNITRHGFFEDDPAWSLDVRTKDPGSVGSRPTIECPNCGAIYRGGKCRACGYEPSSRDLRAQGLQFDGSDLQKIAPNEKPASKSPEELMVRALFMSGRSGRTWRQAVGIFKMLTRKHELGSCYVPKRAKIAGRSYQMIRFGSDDANRRISALYPVTIGRGHGGPYLIDDLNWD